MKQRKKGMSKPHIYWLGYDKRWTWGLNLVYCDVKIDLLKQADKFINERNQQIHPDTKRLDFLMNKGGAFPRGLRYKYGAFKCVDINNNVIAESDSDYREAIDDAMKGTK